ncbi:hypothetical protein PAMP_015157 [Pampus punctatissimus]
MLLMLCAKAPLQAHLPLYSEDHSSLCMHHLLADGIHSDSSCLPILVFYQACHKRTKQNGLRPTTVPPASLVSLCFHSVENQELPQMCFSKAIMLCFNNT